ncbi:enoyl-CoA hydratase-related protein [Dietzia maris]|uniref:enoyl-CoA hydratase-related protein n=1 Tax=Dietzia maris TaxID=37915 RepID=UPI0037CAAA21
MTESSTAHIDSVKRLYAALGKGDREVIEEILSPDFVGHTTEGLPMGLGGTFRGPREMIDEFWWRIGSAFAVRSEPESYEFLEGRGLQVWGRYRGTNRATGRVLDAEFVHIVQFENERISSLRQITDSSAWCAAHMGAERASVPAYTDIPLGDLETIDYSVNDHVARIILDRPASRNAIDLRLADEVLVVARAVAADPSVRAVLIAGNGPALTVGGDIDFFTDADAGSLGALIPRMVDPFHRAFEILDQLDVPIVTAAHGSVAGGGLGFVYAADITLAAEGTIFATGFGAIGLSGDGGGTWHLPRIIGEARARRMYIENLRLDAERAEQWGLVAEVVPPGELRDRAEKLVTTLAAGPTRAYGEMRALFGTSWRHSFAEQLDAEKAGLARTGSTHDANAAVTAFVSNKRPHFEGR